MREIEGISKGKDRRKTRNLQQRIQHEIDLGLRNQDGTPKARLIKKNRHRPEQDWAPEPGTPTAPTETKGNP
jgi:hypothetical protein